MAETTAIDWSRCDGFDNDFGDVRESLTVEEMRERIRTTGSTLPVERTVAVSGEANTKGASL